MSYTMDELIALRRAYATGARVVQYADKRIEYTSGEEMIQRIRVIEGALGVTTGAGRGGRRFAQFDKGL